MSNMNPLSKYTKIEVLYTKLISNDVIKYPEGVIEHIECGVCARSARDELMFNNPDALMNGEAVVNVINNCVPNVKNARKLFVTDVEQLLIAIKIATKEKTYEIETECPNCGKHGAFERNLQALLDTAQEIDKEPCIAMEDGSGLVVFFTPHTWEQHSKFGLDAFHNRKRADMLDENEGLSDEEKMTQMSSIFSSMAKLQYDMLLANISRIELPDGEIVNDKSFINEWLESLTKDSIMAIMDSALALNDAGISHEMDVGCSECGHEWTIEGLQFDPTSFFVQSFSHQSQKK